MQHKVLCCSFMTIDIVREPYIIESPGNFIRNTILYSLAISLETLHYFFFTLVTLVNTGIQLQTVVHLFSWTISHPSTPIIWSVSENRTAVDQISCVGGGYGNVCGILTLIRVH